MTGNSASRQRFKAIGYNPAMRESRLLAGVLLFSLLTPASARADLAPFNGVGVTFAHFHLSVKDIEVHKKFWTDVMGGTFVTNGPLQMIQLPGAYIVLTQADSSGPPDGSVLNHFGFVYKDLPATLARWKAMGADARPGGNPNQGYVWGPDGINIEYYGDPAILSPVKMDHTHSFVPDINACKDWYKKVLGGVPGQRPRVSGPAWNEVVHFPGMTVTFAGSQAGAALAPTQGRSLDHMGFEVKDLAAFSKRLEALGIPLDSAPRQIPGTRIVSAYLTDPWGTRIELTQNLPPASEGRGGRGGEVLVPTALLSGRNVSPGDFPTLKGTTGNVYVWQDVHALGFLTNNLIVITSDGVLVADGQNSLDATKRMVDAIGLLTSQPIKYVVVCSEHGDHTGGNKAFPSTATFISTGRVLKMGSTEIQILNSGRAHTGNDLQVYLPQAKILFTSESFSSHIFPSMANARPAEWIQTVKKLRQIDATFVVPGHGFLDPVPNMTREMAEFERALEYVVGEVTRIHKTGVGVEEGLKQVNWGPYAAWSVFERNAPVAFRRIYDELDGKLK